MKVSEIDTDLFLEHSLEKENIKFIRATSAPIKTFGVFIENGHYTRLPEKIAKATSEGVLALSTNTAGGRVKFITDSRYIAMKCNLGSVCKMAHMPQLGISSFDLYINENDGRGDRFAGNFHPVPKFDVEFDSIRELDGKKMREITINFPLYNNLETLYIGLESGAEILSPNPYKHTKPVVYYGSSITQGGCATRAGMSYQAILSRHCDCDHINLGFSGSAKGESAMSEYISKLNMSAFVLDYDYNAPSCAELEKTHKPFFMTVRNANPTLPIILMTRPKTYLNSDEEKRNAIVRATYEEAIQKGDKNVYFIDGRNIFFPEMARDCTVDGTHPTDLGFYCMATALEPVLQDILEKEENK